jgi:uncharacterized protein (TIGR02145 family)
MLFTFDNVNEADDSRMYIEGVYRRDGSSRSLKNVVYKGLKSDSGTMLDGYLEDGEVTFSFDNLLTESGGRVTRGFERLFYTGTTTTWQRDSEFDSDNVEFEVETQKSALVMLVLDCTKSLGTSGFSTLKSAANGFINILSGVSLVSSGSGGGESGVSIGNRTWASRNVGGTPGTFAASPESHGGYYNFHEAQTACPSGWRLPSIAEFEELNSRGSVWGTSNGVNGRRYGNNLIFLPAAGYYIVGSATDHEVGEIGYYYSNSQYDDYRTSFWELNSDYSDSGIITNSDRAHIRMSVRCVR